MVETVLIKLTVRKLVGRLKFIIVWQMFLHCIVGKMDALANLSGCELFRGSANVALLVPIKFEASTHLHTQYVATYVEFSLFIQKGSDIFLKQKGSLFCTWWIVEDILKGFLSSSKYADTMATICKFSRFENPHLLFCPQLLHHILPVETCNMMRFRYSSVRINIDRFVIFHHILVQQFLIGDLPVIGQMVGQEKVIWKKMKNLLLFLQFLKPILET